MNSCKIISLNYRGLRSSKDKRLAIFRYIGKKPDIVFLQETNSRKNDRALWEKAVGHEMFLNHSKTQDAGTGIIVMSNQITIDNHMILLEGRAHVLIATIKGYKIACINIYALNQDISRKDFFELITNKIQALVKVDYMVLGGEFNPIQDPVLDREGGSYCPGTRCSKLRIFKTNIACT